MSKEKPSDDPRRQTDWKNIVHRRSIEEMRTVAVNKPIGDDARNVKKRAWRMAPSATPSPSVGAGSR